MTKRRTAEKLTKRVIDAAQPEPKRYVVWDSKLSGFGLRVEPSGRKTFIARYRVGGGRSGTLRQATIGRYGAYTPETARKRAQEILGAAASGTDPVSEQRNARRLGATVAEVCDWYLEQAGFGRILGRKGRPIKHSTVAMDRSRIETHVKPLIGKRAVRSLATHDLERMQTEIAMGKTAMPKSNRCSVGGGVKRARGGLATGGNGVARRTLGMLRSIFEHASRNDLIEENPAKGARKLAENKRNTRLSLDQIRQLGAAMREAASIEREASENSTGFAAIRFLMLSGFRRNEALAMERAWILREGGVSFPDTKSGAQIRPLGRAAMSVLNSQCQFSDGRWVFPADRGSGHFVGLAKVLDRVCHQAKLQRITPHVLRHTFASVAADLGYSELTIAGLLGHASRGVTAGYVHLDSVLVDAADHVSGVIAEALGVEETSEPFLGETSSSGFNSFSRVYKSDPTIENYVRLRREHPEEFIEVAISSSFEWASANEELLSRFDLPVFLVVSTLDADVEAISELSLRLMERIIARTEAERRGGTHLVSRGICISDGLVNFLINMMLDSLDWNDRLHIPRDLIVLIRHQIGSERSEWDIKNKKSEDRIRAANAAIGLAVKGEAPSYRKVAKELGVDATTVKRWFPNDEFTGALEGLKELSEDLKR